MVKNLPANSGHSGDASLIPGSGRFPGLGNDNLFQYSCLKNSMYRGALWAIVHGFAKSQTWLHTHTRTSIMMAKYVKCLTIAGISKDVEAKVRCAALEDINMKHKLGKFLLYFKAKDKYILYPINVISRDGPRQTPVGVC